MNMKLPPPPPPPTPEEEKEIEEKEEEENPTEDNEWAEYQWRLRSDNAEPTSFAAKKKDPCDDRTDCTVQCAMSSEIPTPYKKNKELSMSTGVCGYKMQVTNINEKSPFLLSVLRTGAVSLALPIIAASATAFTLF